MWRQRVSSSVALPGEPEEMCSAARSLSWRRFEFASQVWTASRLTGISRVVTICDDGVEGDGENDGLPF